MTSQEFFSHKKFKKDLRRFELLKRSLSPKEMDYDLEVSRCEELINKLACHTSQSSFNSELFYEIDKRTTERIEHLRTTFNN